LSIRRRNSSGKFNISAQRSLVIQQEAIAAPNRGSSSTCYSLLRSEKCLISAATFAVTSGPLDILTRRAVTQVEVHHTIALPSN
jgi:hypothetical protein